MIMPELILPEQPPQWRKPKHEMPSFAPVAVKAIAADDSLKWQRIMLFERAKGSVYADVIISGKTTSRMYLIPNKFLLVLVLNTIAIGGLQVVVFAGLSPSFRIFCVVSQAKLVVLFVVNAGSSASFNIESSIYLQLTLHVITKLAQLDSCSTASSH